MTLSLPVFQAKSCISTELLLIGSCWSLKTCSCVWRGPQEYITCECPACPIRQIWMVIVMVGVQIAVQLLFCGMMFPGFVQYGSYHFCAFTVKLLFHTLSQRPCGSFDANAAWEKLRFIFLHRSEFSMTDSLSIAVHTTYWCHFPSMRRCFRGKWICPQVLETYNLLWRCRLFN